MRACSQRSSGHERMLTKVEGSLTIIQPPRHSDGDPARHPRPQRPLPRDTETMRYSRASSPFDPTRNEMVPMEPERPSVQHWLRMLGEALAQSRWSAAGISPEQANSNRNQPSIMLSEFPAGYKIYEHLRSSRTRPSTKSVSKKSKDGYRRDVYVFGHPTGKRFRSPGEMIPHLLWLERDPLARDKLPCNCCLCTLPKHQIKLAVQSPVQSPAPFREPSPSLLVAVKKPTLQSLASSSVTLKKPYDATPIVASVPRVTAEMKLKSTPDRSKPRVDVACMSELKMMELRMMVENAELEKHLGDTICRKIPENQKEQSVELTFLNYGPEHFRKKPKDAQSLNNSSLRPRTISIEKSPNIHTYSVPNLASSPSPPSQFLPLQSHHPLLLFHASRHPSIPLPTLDSTPPCPPQTLDVRAIPRLLREHGARGCLATWLSCGVDPALGREICDCDTCVWWRIEQLGLCASENVGR